MEVLVWKAVETMSNLNNLSGKTPPHFEPIGYSNPFRILKISCLEQVTWNQFWMHEKNMLQVTCWFCFVWDWEWLLCTLKSKGDLARSLLILKHLKCEVTWCQWRWKQLKKHKSTNDDLKFWNYFLRHDEKTVIKTSFEMKPQLHVRARAPPNSILFLVFLGGVRA